MNNDNEYIRYTLSEFTKLFGLINFHMLRRTPLKYVILYSTFEPVDHMTFTAWYDRYRCRFVLFFYAAGIVHCVSFSINIFKRCWLQFYAQQTFFISKIRKEKNTFCISGSSTEVFRFLPDNQSCECWESLSRTLREYQISMQIKSQIFFVFAY